MNLNEIYPQFNVDQINNFSSNNDSFNNNNFSNCNFNFLNESNYYTSNEWKLNSNKNNLFNFNIININIRSLKKNFDKLIMFLNTFDDHFDIVSITETWLSDNNIFIFNIPGYNHICSNRKHKNGGGVLIYIREHYQFNILSTISNNYYDNISIEIIFEKSKNIIFITIYFPPTLEKIAHSTFIDFLINNFQQHVSNDKKMIICGDFNIDLVHINTNKVANTFFDTMISLGCSHLINRPTRIDTKHNSSSIIDNIFTNFNLNMKRFSGIIISDISDHFPIVLNLQLSTKPQDKVKSTKIKQNQINDRTMFNLFEILKKTNWEFIKTNDTEKSWNLFLEYFILNFDRYCPKINKASHKNKLIPWNTRDLKKACRKKQILYKKYKISKSENDLFIYKIFKNNTTSLVREAKKKYYSNLLKNCSDTKNTWNVLNNLLNVKKKFKQLPDNFNVNNVNIVDSKQIANEFNSFFRDIGSNLDNNINNCNDDDFKFFLPEPNIHSFFLTPVSSEEIIKVLNEFKPKKSRDHYGISMQLLKCIFPVLVYPFVFLVNLSFESGVVPDFLKLSNIIPLHKTGDDTFFNNYRPISLTCQFAKILEKIFYSRFYSFLSSFNILSPSQFGFRKGYSTSHAIFNLQSQISTCFNNNNVGAIIFIDLKKAFDTLITEYYFLN